MYSARQIADGEVVSVLVDRPDAIPEGQVVDYRLLPEGWRWVLVIPVPAVQEAPRAQSQASQPQQVPVVPQRRPGGWWAQDVRFLLPKAQCPPYKPALALQVAVGVPLAIGVGLVASRFLHSDTGRYVIRSIIRGLCYRLVGALTR